MDDPSAAIFREKYVLCNALHWLPSSVHASDRGTGKCSLCTTSPLRNFAPSILCYVLALLHHDTPSSGDTSPLSSWLW